jgi:hypothetical protein
MITTKTARRQQMMAHTMYVPDNPDGSGDTTYTVWDRDETPHEIHYHYEHVAADSLWEVQALKFMVPTTHLNTYKVPGSLLARLLLDLEDQEAQQPDGTIIYWAGEYVISVRRCS